LNNLAVRNIRDRPIEFKIGTLGKIGSNMRILLIEDDVKVASLVERGLNEAGFAVEHAINGEEGLRMALKEQYDTAIVDIMLPKLDGLSLIEQLRRQKVNIPILILSAKRSVIDRVRGLQGGSDDYLTKPFAFAELLARVQALIRRTSAAPKPSRLVVGDLSIELMTRVVKRGDQEIHLQPREYALLEYLARNAGKVVSRTMIMENVWDYNFDPMTNVVDVRICKLRDKIDKDFDTKLLHTVWGAGYVLKATP
jgi:two-component system OmpR family response regulator